MIYERNCESVVKESEKSEENRLNVCLLRKIRNISRKIETNKRHNKLQLRKTHKCQAIKKSAVVLDDVIRGGRVRLQV